MKNRNRFAGALLGIAMLGGTSALLVQPSYAQDASATPAATPAAPAPADTGAMPATPDTSTTPAAPDAGTATPATSGSSATPATPATPDTGTAPATPPTPDTSSTPTPPAVPDASTPPLAPDTAPAAPDTSAAPMMPVSTNVAVPLTQLISPTPGDYSPPATLSTGPIDATINYHALANMNLNQNDLQVASAHHYSDRQIAKILKLSQMTGYSFTGILRRVADGDTFPFLCQEYGVSLKALADVKKQVRQVDDYESAIAATGKNSFKRPSVLGSAFSAPGSEGSVLAETPDLNRPLPVSVSTGS